MMGCGNTWTREAVKGLASDTVTVRERILDGLVEAVFTGEIQAPPVGMSIALARPGATAMALLLDARGYTFRSAGNERRQEHEVVDAGGEVMFTGSTAAIAEWLQS